MATKGVSAFFAKLNTWPFDKHGVDFRHIVAG
jgi:hypothetical protein